MLQIRLFEYSFEVSVVFLHILLYQFSVCLLQKSALKNSQLTELPKNDIRAPKLSIYVKSTEPSGCFSALKVIIKPSNNGNVCFLSIIIIYFIVSLSYADI